MRIEGGHEGACIDENTALDFVQGRLPAPVVRDVDQHADGCPECRVLIDEAARSFRDRSTFNPAGGKARVTVFTRGDVLAGRYRITRFIARGGMGEVYEAEDLLLGTRLAVKTMNAEISDDTGAIRRLKQEANLARRITHQNVCRIFDIGIHEPSNPRPGERVLFLTMELIDGVSLGERLRLGGALPVSEVRPIVQAMVAALGAAHRAGVVHRDFKSDNVMLSTAEKGESAGEGAAPRVVVMDFGLARDTWARTGSSSLEGGLTGTLAYMAPEQLEGKPTGPATDVYALGTVMFEMLTGQLPFDGEPPLGGALKRLTETAPSLRALVPEIAPVWESIVGRCLERDPELRPSPVDEVVRVMGTNPGDAAAADSPAPPSDDRTRKVLSLRPGAVRAGAMIAIAAAVAVVVVVAAGPHFRAPRERPPAVAADPTTTTTTMSARVAPPRETASTAAPIPRAPPPTAQAAPGDPRADPHPDDPTMATDGAGSRLAVRMTDGNPAGRSGHAKGGSGRNRRNVARPAVNDHPDRVESAPGGVLAIPARPPAATQEAIKPRSQDLEDGFIFPR